MIIDREITREELIESKRILEAWGVKVQEHPVFMNTGEQMNEDEIIQRLADFRFTTHRIEKESGK